MATCRTVVVRWVDDPVGKAVLACACGEPVALSHYQVHASASTALLQVKALSRVRGRGTTGMVDCIAGLLLNHWQGHDVRSLGFYKVYETKPSVPANRMRKSCTGGWSIWMPCKPEQAS